MADVTPDLILHIVAQDDGGLPGGRIIKIKSASPMDGLDDAAIEEFVVAAADAVRAVLTSPAGRRMTDEEWTAAAEYAAASLEPVQDEPPEPNQNPDPASEDAREVAAEEPERDPFDEPVGDVVEVEDDSYQPPAPMTAEVTDPMGGARRVR